MSIDHKLIDESIQTTIHLQWINRQKTGYRSPQKEIPQTSVRGVWIECGEDSPTSSQLSPGKNNNLATLAYGWKLSRRPPTSSSTSSYYYIHIDLDRKIVIGRASHMCGFGSKNRIPWFEVIAIQNGINLDRNFQFTVKVPIQNTSSTQRESVACFVFAIFFFFYDPERYLLSIRLSFTLSYTIISVYASSGPP